MNNFIGLIRVEFKKIFSSKIWWLVSALVILLQPLLALMSAKEVVSMGLNATPATQPDLVQTLPSIEYLGIYDVVPFGLLPMVVLGGVAGASEYRNHCMRTTLLCCGNRTSIFMAKVISFFVSSILLSTIAIYLTVIVTHIHLGALGLNPWTLSSITWKFMIYAILEWCVLALLAFGMGVLSRNVIVPLIFLIPQIYGLAPYLAEKYSWGEFLPVTAGQLLLATPIDALTHDPIKGGFILSIWVLLLLTGAMYSFVRRDIGGRY